MDATPLSHGLVDGTIRSNGGAKGTVRMESVYAVSAMKLWLALTDPNHLSRWVAQVAGDLRPGGSFTARFTSGWEGGGLISLCKHAQRLTLRMSPGMPDETTIDALLATEGSGTRLIVEESGIPLTEIGAHGAGWQTHIEDLGRHVDGKDQRDWRTRWAELAPAYEQKAASLRQR